METTALVRTGKQALNERTCPVCGGTAYWAWRPVRHFVGDDKIVHFKGAFGGAGNGSMILASMLVNGKVTG